MAACVPHHTQRLATSGGKKADVQTRFGLCNILARSSAGAWPVYRLGAGSCFAVRGPSSSLLQYRVQCRMTLMNPTVTTVQIIAIKTALWQFSKKGYCVLVHGPRLKSKKLPKCDSWKLKFHTKPHNNHNTWNAAFNFNLYCTNNWQHACIGERITRGKGLLHVAFNSVCDYCEVLCEILIFSYHISVISYFLDGVHGLEHNNLF